MAQILLVEDEPAIRESLAFALRRDGFEVSEAASLREARQLAGDADLMILDLVLPDGNGLDFLRSLRGHSDVPVIVLTSRDEETDRVVGLEIGADDYVVKPVRMRELLARIAAHLRKARLDTTETTAGRLEFKDLVIDINERRIFKEGTEVDLTHTEFDLLAYLASHAGKVMSREKILNHVWGYEYPIETRLIDVHIRNLRRKIETNSSRPYYILAVPGIGYRFTSART